MSSDFAWLEQKFGSVVKQPDITSEFQSIMRIFKLSVEELYNKWEVYDMNNGNNKLPLTIERLKELRDQIQKDLENENYRSRKVIQTPVRTVKRAGILTSSPVGDNFLDNILQGSASKKRAAHTPVRTPSKHTKTSFTSSPGHFLPSSPVTDAPISSSTGPSYANRFDRGTTLEVLNEHVQVPSSSENKGPVSLSVNVDLKKYFYRTMYQKISEVAEYLDERIESFIPEILNFHKIQEDQLGNPALVLQQEIVAVGRIVPESPIDERLNKNSIYFESCRRIGAGMRVKLKFLETTPFHFFPGQIVAIKGSNASGEYFAVSEILDLPLLPPPATSLSHLKNFNLDTRPLQVMTAAGPFTLGNDLDFSPFDDLIKEINETTKPDVVILMGPFIDVTNKSVVQGKFEVHNSAGEINPNATLDDLFREVISSRIKQIDPSVLVVMIPHVRDTASNHSAFPQSPFNRKELELPKEVKCLSNPATFSLNEVVFTVSSQDILHDLTKVTTKHQISKSFFTTCMEDILSQRTVYPLFPGSTKYAEQGKSLISSACLDIPYMGLAEFTQVLPDVLIIPSILKPSVQVTNNVVTLNPGFLVKHSLGGQYAKLTIGKLDASELEIENDKEGAEEPELVNDVWKRARVEIKKI